MGGLAQPSSSPRTAPATAIADDEETRVLVWAPFGGDGAALVRLAHAHGTPAHAVRGLSALLEALPARFGALVLTEEALDEAAGRALAAALEEQPPWSSAPMLVLVSDAERPPPGLARVEALGSGASVVILGRPAAPRSIVSALRALLDARARQRVVRDQLAEIEARRDHLRFLLDELDHRVRNTLAKVQSIARLTARQAVDLSAFRDAFDARLRALARAHELLSGDRERPAGLRAVAEGALEPFRGDDASCVRMSGPDVALWPEGALTLGLTLHELATNAAKHGALSAPGGRVTLEWALRAEGDPMLDLLWSETGGPPVRPPEHRSFGRLLIEDVAPRELGGVAELRFAPEGVTCRLTARLPKGHVGAAGRPSRR